MKHTLRPYQRRACIQVVAARERHPLLVAPTGAGKTTMGVYIAQAFAPRRVVWLAHRTELIEQAVHRFDHHGISVGVIQAGRDNNPDAAIRVASVQTLARRPMVDAGVFIIDEAHRANAASYQKVLPESAFRIGLTATPFRTDGRGLGKTFGELVVAATPAQLVASGTLIDPEVYIVKPPNMDGVTRRAGDFAAGESAARINTPEHRADMIEHWKRRCDGSRTLAFAVNVEHSREIAAAFTAAGVPAEHVDAETPPAERAAAIARLTAGETLVLCNCMLFTEGFDLPAIEAVLLARPTASLALHLQMVGRVMRTAPGKTRAIVHDHAGNHLRLGRVTQDIDYTLDDDRESRTSLSEPLGLTHCGECYRLFAGNKCPTCGVEIEPRDAETIGVHGTADMVPMTEEDEREAYFDRLCEEQVMYDRKDGWIGHRFKEKYGEWPATVRLEEDGPLLYVNPDRSGMDIKRAYFRDRLAFAVDRGFKHGWASVKYREVFGVWPRGFVNEVKQELGLVEDDSILEATWA